MLCKKCNQEKELSDFYAKAGSTCKTCFKERCRLRRLANLEKCRQYDRDRGRDPNRKAQHNRATKSYEERYPTKAYEIHRDYHLRAAYGLSIELYEAMVVAQNNKCACCSDEVVGILAVDHNHNTGKVRGLLCQRCNHAIGHLKDSAKRALLVAEYLTKYGDL